MSRNVTATGRRSFLIAGGAAAISAAVSMPALAEPAPGNVDPWMGRELTSWERIRLIELGELLGRKFQGSNLEPEMMDNHLRLRIPAAGNYVAGKDKLTPQGVAVMTLVAEGMRVKKKVRVEIVAHHDMMAPDYDSWIFTRRRAEAARGALISRGIPADRVRPTGLGGNFPYLADGRKPENQRLELLFRPL